MGSGLKFKPKDKLIRCIYGDGAALAGMDHAKQHPDKIFAVIGPFDSHMDKTDIQRALELICIGANTEEK